MDDDSALGPGALAATAGGEDVLREAGPAATLGAGAPAASGDGLEGAPAASGGGLEGAPAASGGAAAAPTVDDFLELLEAASSSVEKALEHPAAALEMVDERLVAGLTRLNRRVGKLTWASFGVEESRRRVVSVIVESFSFTISPRPSARNGKEAGVSRRGLGAVEDQ
ncbi:hypothetical protein M885DRAFT_620452 [Pelagophyceae sp. CCMP2097]|nr:hypothetical protein M885DRAFT_620452 [Pelagophyceae sp. CCMP2097]